MRRKLSSDSANNNSPTWEPPNWAPRSEQLLAHANIDRTRVRQLDADTHKGTWRVTLTATSERQLGTLTPRTPQESERT